MINNIIYKDIPGYEGMYQISNTGIVKSLERTRKFGNTTRTFPEKILKPSIRNGRYFVNLSKNSHIKSCFIHQLVLLAFVGKKPFEKAEVRHLNSNSLDNRLENLKYGTKSENMQDAVEIGTLVFSRTKLTKQQVQDIASSPLKISEISKKYTISTTTVINIKNKKSFKNFTSNIIYNKRKIIKLNENILNFIRDRNNSRKYIIEKTGYSIAQIKRIRKGFDTITIK